MTRVKLTWGACLSLLLAGCHPTLPPESIMPTRSGGRIAVANGTWQTEGYNANAPKIEYNPLKGFVPWEWQAGNTTGFPNSMEAFYIPLSSIMTGYDSYDWNKVFEPTLNRIKGRGNHALARIYLDYPTNNAQNFPLGTPAFLIQAGVPMRSYTELSNTVSKAPDWNDERVVSALERFAKAYGARYNADSRIGFIQVGLYGFWGEWHTHPYQPDGNGQDWRMNDTNRKRILTAFQNAFPWKQVMVRDPLGSPDANQRWNFGYYDDSFCYETLYTSWHFWPKMTTAGITDVWKYRPIGGEIRPEIWASLFNSWDNTDNKAQKVSECIYTTHASWMNYMWIFDNSHAVSQTQRDNALRAHKLMGYQYYVSQVKLNNTTTSSNLTFSVKIKNNGVAPFYYDWMTEFYIVNPATNSSVKWLGEVNWNIAQFLPGTETEKSYTVSHGLARGTYRLIMKTKNPNSNDKPLRYANENQDLNWNGYLTLGDFTVN